MKPGPPPKPTALVNLSGRKKRLNKREPVPPRPESVPYAPKDLKDSAKREWNRIVRQLIDLGLFTSLDYAALAMYCQSYGRWIDAERKIAETGGELITPTEGGGLYQNPWLAVSKRAFEQSRKILSEFGLTPSARSRLSITTNDKEPSLADFLFQATKEE